MSARLTLSIVGAAIVLAAIGIYFERQSARERQYAATFERINAPSAELRFNNPFAEADRPQSVKILKVEPESAPR
jgi:hypothetical protein